MSEVNVKEIEFLTDTSGILVKKIKPNFKTLGPKYGKIMKQIAAFVNGMTQEDISRIEKEGVSFTEINGEKVEITIADVEIISEDIPGWLVAVIQEGVSLILPRSDSPLRRPKDGGCGYDHVLDTLK